MSENTAYRVNVPTPRQYSLVKYDISDQPEEFQKNYADGNYEFSPNHRYIFLGEIPNMQGHCIVMDDKGKHYVGYHIENFIELTDDEQDVYAPVGYNWK